MTQPRVLFVGRATLDVVYVVDDFPPEDTKVFAEAMHVAPGGPATNAAITHALLGGSAVLMTALGGGPWAARVRQELDPLGVEVLDLADGTAYQAPLVTVLASSSRATRTIVNAPRCEVALTRPEAWDPRWGEPPGFVLTDGFHVSETLKVLADCHARGAQVCLDGGSWKAGTEDLAGMLSVAICGERFAVPGASIWESSIDWLKERGVARIAVTRGAKPICGWDQGRTFSIDIEACDAMDTTGAGDVLHGAFCYHFARTGNFEESLRLASQVATRSCRGIGVRAWMDLPGRRDPAAS